MHMHYTAACQGEAMAPSSSCYAGLSPACDVYSFGVIMFELFSGETAFHGANLGNLIFKIGACVA